MNQYVFELKKPIIIPSPNIRKRPQGNVALVICDKYIITYLMVYG